MTINKKLYDKLSVYQPCWPWFETSDKNDDAMKIHIKGAKKMNITFEKKLFIGFSLILFQRILGRFPTNEEYKKILQDETTNEEKEKILQDETTNEEKENNFKMSEFIKDTNPEVLINFKIPLYHLNEIYKTGRGIVYALEHDEEKKSFCQIRLSIWKIILEEIENTLNKE